MSLRDYLAGENAAALSHNGGDPYQLSDADAATAAALAARSAPQEEAPPASRPGTWERVSGLFKKQKQDAKARYLLFLKKTEVDGKELSAGEIAELVGAMREAGISADDAQQDREMLQRHRAARAAAADLAKESAALPAVLGGIAALEAKIKPLAAQAEALSARAANLRLSIQTFSFAARNVEALNEQVSELFRG